MKSLVLSLSAVLLLAGCVGPARTVTYQPVQGQVVSVADADARACERASEGQEDRRLRFAACMMAKDYRTSLQLGSLAGLFGEPMVYATTIRTARQEPEAIAGDIRTCRELARVTTRERAGVILAWPLYDPGPQISERFRGCLEPRGYQVLPWEGYQH